MNFKKFLQLNEAGGQASGKLEINTMTYIQAIEFCDDFEFDVEKKIDNFKKHFEYAQKLSNKGHTKRKDMPVIDSDDVKKFQKRLENGNLDINKPFSKDELVKSNPFPTGLSGLSAKKFLGLGLTDGSLTDDKIDVSIVKTPVGKLIPIQKQIYFDKSMGEIIKNGILKSKNFISKKSFFIISSDNRVIDGHHRLLSAILLDPTLDVFTLKINLPLKKLLPLSLAYGDAIGNKRNA